MDLSLLLRSCAIKLKHPHCNNHWLPLQLAISGQLPNNRSHTHATCGSTLRTKLARFSTRRIGRPDRHADRFSSHVQAMFDVGVQGYQAAFVRVHPMHRKGPIMHNPIKKMRLACTTCFCSAWMRSIHGCTLSFPFSHSSPSTRPSSLSPSARIHLLATCVVSACDGSLVCFVSNFLKFPALLPISRNFVRVLYLTTCTFLNRVPIYSVSWREEWLITTHARRSRTQSIYFPHG